MKKHFLIWVTLLGCLLVLGCQNETETTSENSGITKGESMAIPEFDSVDTDQVFEYNCGDSLEFTAHVTPDSTWLFLADTTVKVLPTRSASGARYEGNRYLYWSKGTEAILQKPVGSFMQCQSIPQERSWAAAKLRGVYFRAVGQEPGWFIEINQNAQSKYVGNYGEDTLYFDSPEPQRDNNGDTIYQMTANNTSLHLTISDISCRDVMSGFEHPQSVTVTINDTTTYSGCGRYLN